MLINKDSGPGRIPGHVKKFSVHEIQQDDDYTCEYPKHDCEIRTRQLSKKTRRERISDSVKSIVWVSPHHFMARRHLRSRGATQLEIIRQRKSKHPYIIHPFSLFSLSWDICMVSVALFTLIFCPYRFAFLNAMVAKYRQKRNMSLRVLLRGLFIHTGLDFIWLLNCVMGFLTGIYDSASDRVIIDPKLIAKKYMPFRFFLDLVCSIPVEYIIFVIYGKGALKRINQTVFVTIQIYNICSFIKFYTYIPYLKYIGFLTASYFIYRVIGAIIMYLLLMHWSLCLTLIVPQIIYGEKWFDSDLSFWVQVEHLYDKSFADQYIMVLLRTLFTHVGVSTWISMFAADDFLIAIITAVAGKIYWTFFLIWFLESIAASNALRAKFRLIRDQLKKYMKQKEVPMYMKKRLNRFYFYRFQSHYFRDRAILDRLSESLRQEISEYTSRELLQMKKLFRTVPKQVIVRFAQKMNREMYFPQDVIVRANTYGDCMYFVCSGTVAVSTVSEKVVCTLEDGDFFGEIALIADNRTRTATVTAVTITEVFRLEESDFKRLTESYPDVYNQLEKYANGRYKTIVTIEGRADST